MELKQATRSQAKIKLGLQGCSGSGKTMGALLIAVGLCGDFTKIAVIDTENHSACLYAHLGNFFVVSLTAPFTPEKYIEAIQLCERAGMQVVIIDSISHEWESTGGILSIHSSMAGNSFSNWAKITPRHNAFIQAILQSPLHIIGTIRSKQEYVLNEKNGKQVPEKVGLKGITREGLDYELTIMLDIDIKHLAVASKDRTRLFMDQPAFTITENTGRLILNWCSLGIPEQNEQVEQDELIQSINACSSIAELGRLYIQHPEHQQKYNTQFTRRKKELQLTNHPDLLTQNISSNGNSTIQS